MPKLEIEVDQQTYDGLLALRELVEASNLNNSAWLQLKAALIAAEFVCDRAEEVASKRPAAKRRAAMRSFSIAFPPFYTPNPTRLADETGDGPSPLTTALSTFPDWNDLAKGTRDVVAHYLAAAATDGAIDDEDGGPGVVPDLDPETPEEAV